MQVSELLHSPLDAPLPSSAEQEAVALQLLAHLRREPGALAAAHRYVGRLGPQAQARFALGWVQPEEPGAKERVRQATSTAARPGVRGTRASRWVRALTVALVAGSAALAPQTARAESPSWPALQEAEAAEGPRASHRSLIPAWSEAGREHLATLDAGVAQRLEHLAGASPAFRQVLERIRDSGTRTLILRPEEARTLLRRKNLGEHEREPAFSLFQTARDGQLRLAVVVLDLDRIRSASEIVGNPAAAAEEDLDLLLSHELVEHVARTLEERVVADHARDPWAHRGEHPTPLLAPAEWSDQEMQLRAEAQLPAPSLDGARLFHFQRAERSALMEGSRRFFAVQKRLEQEGRARELAQLDRRWHDLTVPGRMNAHQAMMRAAVEMERQLEVEAARSAPSVTEARGAQPSTAPLSRR